ncbi:hypothetical protein [Nocardioides sp. Arc9.136]|uniref:hypothetical protein n=1 Tax=Nocardioides sp. Arc9.136 TaxID=2996826 RepID=UPI00266538C3|nr:hypothetical protein [Nocardioides sp. Arc9.136]WKN48630.1 hypothetical protein OSR43_00465 [Nocardioides sp. Arc9.136]
MLNLRRAVATSSLLLLAPLAAACGGDDEASSAPDDASTEDFCTAYSSIFESLVAAPTDGSESEQEQAAVDALKEWSAKMKDVGTPSDLPDDARQGFELVLEQAQDIEDVEDLSELEDSGDYSDSEQEQMKALNTWMTENCADQMPGMGAPSAEAPSPEGLPTEDTTP